MSSQPIDDVNPEIATHSIPLHAARQCGCAAESLPATLLEWHVDVPGSPTVPVTSVGVGYELREWRAGTLADHIMEWVPDFAMHPDERLDHGRVVEKLRRAYRATFGTARGHAPAEILLHAMCREFFGSTTIVHKVVFKTADKDTYKGFDGVHCVHSPTGGLELWLGEAKFYRNLNAALRAVGRDFDRHLTSAYLKGEFAIVGSRLHPGQPHYHDLVGLLEPNQTVERIFTRLVVPVFVTYDSPATGSHQRVCPDYIDALEGEATRAAEYLRGRIDSARQHLHQAGDPHAELPPVQVRLFLLPMADKTWLEDELEKRVAAWLP
ncbi:MAG: HamA C-terminal domain-containing protein [Phycicoccus sp.]